MSQEIHVNSKEEVTEIVVDAANKWMKDIKDRYIDIEEEYSEDMMIGTYKMYINDIAVGTFSYEVMELDNGALKISIK